jgi:hypothetical protein
VLLTSRAGTVQPPDPCGGVVVRQGDDVQPRRFAARQDILGRESPIGCCRVDVKVQAHKTQRIMYENEAKEVFLPAS